MRIITDIPVEVLDEILSYVPTFHPSLGGLHACCLVNRFFNAIATPILYRHIVLHVGAQGFADHVVRSLLSKQYKSHQFIRVISIEKWDLSEKNLTLHNFSPMYQEQDAVHIATFVESLAEEQLQSINSNSLGILKYLPPSYHVKIKSIGCTRAILGEEMAGKPFLPSLRSLIFRELSPSFENSPVDWSICQQYRKQLKSLSLESNRSNNTVSPEPFFLKDLQFETLEYLSLRSFRIVEINESSILKLIQPQNIKQLNLIDCHVPPTFLVPQIESFANLTNLAFYRRFKASDDIYSRENLEDILLNLPNSLHSLHWTAFAIGSPGYPSKRALQRHSTTLRKLWLEIIYNTRTNDDQDGEPSHYQYETRYKMIEVPLRLQDDEALDLETLSQFPNLEHLVIPVAAPTSWTSWAPSFPKLRSFYLVNSCKIYRSSSRPATECFRQDWINWFTSSHQYSDGPHHQNLQLVAFQRPACQWENYLKAPQPGSRGFTAHIRDFSRPGYFSQKAITSGTVRYLYPEAWEFFRGYFMAEKREYIWPVEDTNAAKGVFEDEDEFVNIPKSFFFRSIFDARPQMIPDPRMRSLALVEENRKRLLMARAQQKQQAEATQQCPIEKPKPVVVNILPWGSDDIAESEVSFPLPTLYDRVAHDQNLSRGINQNRLLSSEQRLSVQKSLREYQNDFLLFEEQTKKRQDFVTDYCQRVPVEEFMR